MPSPIPDRVLLKRVAGRDATALLELQRRHGPSLYALVFGILVDAERAERVVAEIFEHVWHGAEVLVQRRGGPAAWLRETAKERARATRAAESLLHRRNTC